jgi:hypothetical protein
LVRLGVVEVDISDETQLPAAIPLRTIPARIATARRICMNRWTRGPATALHWWRGLLAASEVQEIDPSRIQPVRRRPNKLTSTICTGRRRPRLCMIGGRIVTSRGARRCNHRPDANHNMGVGVRFLNRAYPNQRIIATQTDPRIQHNAQLAAGPQPADSPVNTVPAAAVQRL